MSIDFTNPYTFLKTMKFQDYESNSDFLLDMREQVEKLKQENEKLRLEFKNDLIKIGIEGLPEFINLKQKLQIYEEEVKCLDSVLTDRQNDGGTSITIDYLQVRIDMLRESLKF